MRSGILLLPFISVFTLIIGFATGRAYRDLPALSLVFYTIAGLTFLYWIYKDLPRIGTMFKRKGAKHSMSQGLSVLLALLLVVGLGFLSKRDRFNKSVDVTREGANTLSAESIKLVDQLKEKDQLIQVIGFFQSEEKKNEFRKILALYEMRGARFDVEYVDPQTDPTRAMAENITTVDTVLLKKDKQESRLTAFTEEKFTNGLVRVLKEKERTIYFLSGHGEADLGSQEAFGYATTKAELESERFLVKTLNLLESGSIPEDADLIAIAGPKYDLRVEERSLLEAYIQKGKPLLVLVDAMVKVPELNALLSTVGIKLNDDLLVIRPDDPRAKLLGQNNAIITEFDTLSPVTAEFVKRGGVALMTPNSRSLELITENSLKLKPQSLGKTSEIIVRILDVKTEDDLKGGIAPERIANGSFDVFAVASGQVGGDKVASNAGSDQTGADVKGDSNGQSSKEVRVFVGGSAKLASNLGVQRGENLDLFMNAVNFLLQDEDFISIRAKDSTKSTLDLTSATSQFLMFGMTWVYPLLFLAAGIFYWLRRRATT